MWLNQALIHHLTSLPTHRGIHFPVHKVHKSSSEELRIQNLSDQVSSCPQTMMRGGGGLCIQEKSWPPISLTRKHGMLDVSSWHRQMELEGHQVDLWDDQNGPR
ncbi:hypothetical protein KIL84_003907 [Mauremys mutica]|uniref:Uncharacterized protein n=1 Tax=Mauremys mutica TaxID=74926 RepID=A0A9D3WUP3_9SAUR|nr:hypothetical protein KIL84_003907 [Mauremys mutica]